LGASLRVTLSIAIFPKRINNIYRKWEEKASYIRYTIAFGKDFHFNRWRKGYKEKAIAFNRWRKRLQRKNNSFQSLM